MVRLDTYRSLLESDTVAAPVRGLLWAMSTAYGAIIKIRNRWYDRPAAASRVGVPVVSVGNISVGGTGKTPLVIELVERLHRAGRTPAVLSRGYGVEKNVVSDEELLIRKRCAEVVYVANPDRVVGAEDAVRLHRANAIVLDDGFQHRRIHRDLDIVLLDATRPFGLGHMLPRGLLREPPGSLARADLVVITRADLVALEVLAGIVDQVHRLAVDVPCITARHKVDTIEWLDGTPGPPVGGGLRAVLVAGIGNPDAFQSTVQQLGVTVVGHRWWPDHHNYTDDDIMQLLSPGAFPEHDMILTTEKDAVKLLRLSSLGGCLGGDMGGDMGVGGGVSRFGVVKISIDFSEREDGILDELLRKFLLERAT